MSDYFSTLALKYFPRQETPGVIPYKDPREYSLGGDAPPSAWCRMVKVIHLQDFERFVKPPALDLLFAHIQACVDEGYYPRGIGPKMQTWFKYVFPHCCRNIYMSYTTRDEEIKLISYKAYRRTPEEAKADFDLEMERLISQFQREMAMFIFRAQNPVPQHISAKQTNAWLIENMPEDLRQVIVINGLLPYYNWDSSPYKLFAPHVGMYWMRKTENWQYPMCEPHAKAWKLWYEDMLNQSTNVKVADNVLNLCNEFKGILDNKDTPKDHLNHMKNWLKIMTEMYCK